MTVKNLKSWSCKERIKITMLLILGKMFNMKMTLLGQNAEYLQWSKPDFWTLKDIDCASTWLFYILLAHLKQNMKSYRRYIILTLICFKWPENVDNDWDKDCSSPISAKTLSNQGIFADSEDKTWRPVISKKHGEGYAV